MIDVAREFSRLSASTYLNTCAHGLLPVAEWARSGCAASGSAAAR